MKLIIRETVTNLNIQEVKDRVVEVLDFTLASDRVPASLITAKGGIIAGIAAADPRELSTSGVPDGYVLTKRAAASLGVGWEQAGASGNFAQNYRLSLSSGVPVAITDVSAATTLYMVPYGGIGIALYDGSAWAVYTPGEKSISLSGMAANRNHDIFAYQSAGAVALEALAWVNDTTRTTALTYQNGVLVQSGAPTRRYLGTIRTTGTTGQCEDRQASRLVWNYYNRVRRSLAVANSTAHAYTSGAWRYWNNDSSAKGIFVLGIVEEPISAICYCYSDGSNSGNYAMGLNTATGGTPFGTGTVNGRSAGSELFFSGLVSGYNYISLLEFGAASLNMNAISLSVVISG
jgi:hypothetical protein